MKKILVSLLLTGCLPVFGQTTNISDVVNSPDVQHAVIELGQNVIQAKALSLAVYPSYAPDIVVNGQHKAWGAGIALLAPATIAPGLSDNVVAEHLFAGLRFDLLGGGFYASTIGVGLKQDIKLSSKFMVTPFVTGGANIPLAGAGGVGVGEMYGGGVKATLLGLGPVNTDGNHPGSLDIFVAAEKWGQFPGAVYHGGLALSWSIK